MRLDDEIHFNYLKSRACFADGDTHGALMWYRKNRAEHGVELFYEVELPEKLLFVHPIGSVLGRAEYRGALVVYHGVGVGSSLDGARPTLGKGVALFPGSKVLGASVIGDNVFVEANTVIHGQTIPRNSVVSGSRDNLKIRPTKRSVIAHFWGAEHA